MDLSNRPEWLPPELQFSGVDMEDDISMLYSYFKDIFIDNGVFFDNKKVIFNTSIDESFLFYGEYPLGFTHIITKESTHNHRSIDYERARRLPWVKAIIENYRDDLVCYFVDPNHNGSGVSRFYFWLKEYDFVVILSDLKSRSARDKGSILITAYKVDPSYRGSLLRKSKKYTKNMLDIDSRENDIRGVLY